jgi:hypothetical protein
MACIHEAVIFLMSADLHIGFSLTYLTVICEFIYSSHYDTFSNSRLYTVEWVDLLSPKPHWWYLIISSYIWTWEKNIIQTLLQCECGFLMSWWRAKWSLNLIVSVWHTYPSVKACHFHIPLFVQYWACCPHRCYPRLIMVVGFECSWDPESYAGGSVATGRATQAGQVKG